MGRLSDYKDQLLVGMKKYSKENLAGHVIGVGGIWSDKNTELAKFKIAESESDGMVHTETKFKDWLAIAMSKIGTGHADLRLYLCLTKSPCKRCTIVALKTIAETWGKTFQRMRLGFLNIYQTSKDSKYSFQDANEAAGYYIANLNAAWKVTWFHYKQGKLTVPIPVPVTTIVT